MTEDTRRPAESPLVSIVIVTYNSAGVIGACLASLADTGDEVAIEVIVVDNGSTDDTVGVVERAYPQARIVVPGDNLGFARANNLGAESARGSYVWVLNPDTIVRPGALRSLVSTVERFPDACAVGPRLVAPDGGPSTTFGDLPTLGWALATMAPLRRVGITSSTSIQRDLPDGEEPFDAGYACGAALLVRRDCWGRAGGFDPDFFLYFEDVDLCRRLHLAGGRVLVDPSARVVHLEGTSLEGASATASAYFDEGLLTYLRKARGAGAAAIARAWLGLSSVLYLVTGAVLGRVFPGVRANRDIHRVLLRLALRGGVERHA